MDDKSAFWALTAEQAAERLGTGPEGLASAEAERRLAEVGPNRLPEAKRRSALALFLGQLAGFLNVLLVGAAVLAGLIGDVKDAVVIGVVVLFNATLGFVQEHRAEAAVAALQGMLARTARVRRDGEERQLPADQLVPGDLVLLEAGDRVPADGRLLVAHGAEVDESSLTGESVPVAKDTKPIAEPDPDIGDRVNIAFMNTVVTRGRAELLVTATGAKTEMGRLAELLEATEASETPLQGQIRVLGHRLALIAGVAVAIIAAFELARGEPWALVVMSAVAIAVAAIPEGLPAVVTVTLALGMSRMARERAIVKRMAAVETLGCTTDICTDKTGTLTVNQMTAREVAVGGEVLDVTGEGYEPDGVIEGTAPGLDLLLRAAALCNDSQVRDGKVVGDPTEGALWVLAAKGGVDIDALRAEEPRIAELPFEAERKFSATVHPDGTMFVKGAPDVLLERCTALLGPDGIEPVEDAGRKRLLRTNVQMAGSGQRVLALAMRRLDPDGVPAEPDRLAEQVEELVLLGLVGLLDPPRAEAREAVARCTEAGIRVRMITGDHAATGLAIARAIGIEGEAVSGRELDHMSDPELQRRLPAIGVLARVSPEHKLRIVAALRARGRVVAMIGDGVNDAPALKRADIGVAMGITGTQVTQEAATIVLADDNFATVVGAVREGRTIYDNIVRFLRFQLSTNMGALLAVFVAPLVGLPGPFTALQILWVNLIMDGPPAMALGLDPAHPGIMRLPPRDPQAQILTAPRLAVLAFFGLIMASGTLLVLAWAAAHRPEREAITLAFTTFVLFQLFNVHNARFERGTALGPHALTNHRLWVALGTVLVLQVVAVYWKPAQDILGTAALGPWDWVLAVGVAASILVLDELRKAVLSLRLGARWPRWSEPIA